MIPWIGSHLSDPFKLALSSLSQSSSIELIPYVPSKKPARLLEKKEIVKLEETLDMLYEQVRLLCQIYPKKYELTQFKERFVEASGLKDHIMTENLIKEMVEQYERFKIESKMDDAKELKNEINELKAKLASVETLLKWSNPIPPSGHMTLEQMKSRLKQESEDTVYFLPT
jgi:hypothetical protein